jgi:hypothetical protein
MQPGCITARGAVLAIAALLLAACSGGAAHPARPVATVWLCRPGQVDDPCTASLASTVSPATGARSVQTAVDSTDSRFDCFYVYPTVSTERTVNADLRVQAAERAVAIAQASRFSQVCRVWAPMYRQRTVVGLVEGGSQADDVAYQSLLSAWREYLAHDNHGRPIVFIGHSQGAAMLIRLLGAQIDSDQALRSRTVLAILAGGNVTVPIGKTVGATFQHLALCTAAARTRCVIAYSSFPSEPPAGALFGRPGLGVSQQSDQHQTQGVQVACVNPANIGGSADLDPYFPTSTAAPPPPAVTTPWVSYPSLYRASCRTGGGASWLQVDSLTTGGRPVVTETLGPTWGYHLADINLALGDLVADVRAAEADYQH